MSLKITVHRDPKYFLNRDAEELASMNVSADVADFFLSQNLGPSMWTVTASLDGRAVGFFRISMAPVGAQALGTFVHKDYRRQGIATAMWRAARRRLGLKHIDVVAATEDGQGFLAFCGRAAELRDLFLDSETLDC